MRVKIVKHDHKWLLFIWIYTYVGTFRNVLSLVVRYSEQRSYWIKKVLKVVDIIEEF